jgi:NAD(P)-dependent dehydrogenase (short-subunit alcohol dehydrogenase family)
MRLTPTTGIGRATAIALAIAGIDTLYITDIKEEGLRDTHKALEALPLDDEWPRPDIVAREADISCPLVISELFRQIPRLDYAVNCAGVLGSSKPTTEVSLAEFDSVTDVNYRGLWMCVKEELKLMLKNDIRPYNGIGLSARDARRRGQRGSIVTIASQLGIVGKSQSSAYTATKAAVCSLARSDSIDYSRPPHCIRVNAICPGIVETPMTTNLETGEPLSESVKEAVSIAPMNRMGLPSEVADAAVFLCSGESSFMTGTSMVVDGGYTIN